MKINFLGNGSGFTNSHTNAYFTTDSNDLIFIDLSMMHYEKILNYPLHKFENIYVLVTHMHDDHTSGIGMLAQYCYYVLKKKLVILAPNSLLNMLKMDLLIKGIPENIYLPAAPNKRFPWFEAAVPVMHAPELEGNCYGYVLNIDNTTCVYSGDTNNINPLLEYVKEDCEFYLDVSYSYGGVHVKYDDVKEKLVELSNSKVKVILMHIDDINSLKCAIDGTKIEIAKISDMNYYSSSEIKAIKNEVCFNKTELIAKLDRMINYTSIDGDDLYKLQLLYDKIGEMKIEPIIPDFTDKEVEGYIICIPDGTIEKAKATDFYFEHDEEKKELYCASFMW